MTTPPALPTPAPQFNEDTQKLFGEVNRLSGEVQRLLAILAHQAEQNMLAGQSFRMQFEQQQRGFNDVLANTQMQLQAAQEQQARTDELNANLANAYDAASRRIGDLLTELAEKADAKAVPLLDSKAKVNAARLLFGDEFVENRLAAAADTEGGDPA